MSAIALLFSVFFNFFFKLSFILYISHANCNDGYDDDDDDDDVLKMARNTAFSFLGSSQQICWEKASISKVK